MDIQDSVIWGEINEIVANGKNPVNCYWNCHIDVGDLQLIPKQLISIDCNREYDNQFSDELIIRVLLDKDEYDLNIFPNKDNFKVTLFREPLHEVDTATDYDEPTHVRTYRGVLVNPKSSQLTGPEASNQGTTSEVGFKEYYIQLIDVAVEQLRMKSIGGIYRNMTTTEVVHGLLSITAGNLELDNAEALRGVDMVSGNNTEKRHHTIIPHGTPIMEFPHYVQNYAGGIYGSGLRHYIQNGLWFVYPQYNLTRFKDTPKTLTVINLPKNRLPAIERTYFDDKDRLIVIATGNSVNLDVSEELQLNLGNGVRYVIGRNILDGFHTVDKNTSKIESKNNVKSISIDPRKTGLNQTIMSPRRITDNPYREMSDLSIRVGTNIQIEWHNADADLVYPGMPVRYIYMDGDDIHEIYGIVSGNDYYVYLANKGITTKQHRCDVVLSMYLEQPKVS